LDAVATLSVERQKALFRETADRMGIASPVITEKDFWVCWILKRLFGLSGLPSIMFKGGTSLSKAFDLIDRFSEDIDLALNRADLGFGGKCDPLQIKGTNARERANKELTDACKDAVIKQLHPALQADIESVLGDTRWELEFSQKPDGQLDIHFRYPTALDGGEYGGVTFISPRVLLEIGARADHKPTERRSIRPYAAKHFPNMFEEPEVEVLVLAPERTFWEKATIFHSENHRPTKEGETPKQWRNISRHAYDLVMMDQRAVGKRALAQLDLLAEVARHKEVFFRARWSCYDEARPGSFKLAPNENLKAVMRQDYAEMQPMLFGDVPTFEEILAGLESLDHRINQAR
jgi:hypothetical protein